MMRKEFCAKKGLSQACHVHLGQQGKISLLTENPECVPPNIAHINSPSTH